MLKKGSNWYSILTGTCPRCNGDKMYVSANPYTPGKTLKMHDHCTQCGLRYHIEPSFFFGAMYVSYAVNVALAILVFVVAWAGFGWSLPISFAVILAVLLLVMPLTLRWSRTLYINMFVPYDATAASTHKPS